MELDDGGSACGSSGTSSSGDGVKSEPLELADALTNFFATEERDLRCSVCEGPHDKALVSETLANWLTVMIYDLNILLCGESTSLYWYIEMTGPFIKIQNLWLRSRREAP